MNLLCRLNGSVVGQPALGVVNDFKILNEVKMRIDVDAGDGSFVLVSASTRQHVRYSKISMLTDASIVVMGRVPCLGERK
jgi:hypothetical protein